MASGRFTQTQRSYAAGAPRAGGTGQVVLFSRRAVGESVLRVDQVLRGEQFASGYGYELLAVDIDNDS